MGIDSLPLRHNKTASRKPRKIRPCCTPEVSGVAQGVALGDKLRCHDRRPMTIAGGQRAILAAMIATRSEPPRVTHPVKAGSLVPAIRNRARTTCSRAQLQRPGQEGRGDRLLKISPGGSHASCPMRAPDHFALAARSMMSATSSGRETRRRGCRPPQPRSIRTAWPPCAEPAAGSCDPRWRRDS
jgi:hypothetical protein